MCAVKTEDNCFRYTDMMCAACAQYRCWYRSIFSDTDTESIPVVTVDTGGICRCWVPDAGIGLTLAYSGLRGSNYHSLNSLQCVVFANSRESKSITNTIEKIDFDSIRFSKKNSISISDSIIVTSLVTVFVSAKPYLLLSVSQCYIVFCHFSHSQ